MENVCVGQWMQLWRVSKSWLWFQSQWFKTSDLLRKSVCGEQTRSSWNRSFNHKTHFRVKTFADCGQRTIRRRGIIVHYYCWGYPYRVSVAFFARLILNQLSTIPALVRIIPDYGVSLVHIVVIWGRDMCCWTTTVSSTRFWVFVFSSTNTRNPSFLDVLTTLHGNSSQVRAEHITECQQHNPLCLQQNALSSIN